MAMPTLNLWAERNLLLAEKAWPRKIRLEAVGFTDGVAKVAKGANFDLRVRAFRGDTEIPVVPEKVEIRYQYEGGSRERKSMKNIGQPVMSATAADEPLQRIQLRVHGRARSPIHFDIAGGDAADCTDLQLKVVPNPNLSLQLVCEYPRYMEHAPLTIDSVSSAVPVRVPIGSRITIRGTADKALENLQIECPATEGGPAWHRQFRGKRIGPRAELSLRTPSNLSPARLAQGCRPCRRPKRRKGGHRRRRRPPHFAARVHAPVHPQGLRRIEGPRPDPVDARFRARRTSRGQSPTRRHAGAGGHEERSPAGDRYDQR